MKLHQSSLLQGGVVECMVSYTAVEAGNTRAKAAEAAAVTVQVRGGGGVHGLFHGCRGR